MAYVALYRAYRPQSFGEVVGQKAIVTTLQNAIKMNKVAHAYLFSGPRGTGKTTMAKIMAKALNCEHRDGTEPCNECETCKGITKGMIPDVIEIDAASNNGVDAIRELRDGVRYLPSVAKYKVYIIDEVHMLSNSAFNALLKTLEEPPSYVVFILATTEPYNVPNTILSRCQRFDFQAISIEDILERLRIVIKDENVNVTDDALQLIAEVSEGGMRDALSLLDQSISYSTDDVVSLEDVLAVSGNVNNKSILSLLKSAYDSDNSATLNTLDTIIKEGKEIPRIINDLIMFLRDILLFKTNSLKENKSIYQTEDFIYFANKMQNQVIYNWLTSLNQCQNEIRFTNQKRAYLELALLKMSDKEIHDYALLTNKITKLEQEIEDLKYRNPVVQETQVKKVYNVPKSSFNPEAPALKEPVQTELVLDSAHTEQNIPAKEPERIVPTVTGEYVTTSDIEEILNNPNKQKKDKFMELFPRLETKYANVFIVQIFTGGKIVACSDNKLLVVLQDEAFCNRVMKYENYLKLIEILNSKEQLVDDYIAIPANVWVSILDDYRTKYKNGETKPKLNEININVKKRVVPDKKENSDSLVDTAKELFDEDVIKIEEEE